MDFLLEVINTYGMEIIGTVLTALAGVLAMAAKDLATKYINTKIKRDIARAVVQGVEQLYKALSGPEKMVKAMEAAAEMLAAQGITVTDLELHMLLEAAVGEFNDVFNAAALIGLPVDGANESTSP